MLAQDAPDQLVIETEVGVRQLIPEASNLRPANVLPVILKGLDAEMLERLADDFKVAQERIAQKAIFQKALLVDRGELPNHEVDAIKRMNQENPTSLRHRGLASPKIRSLR